MNKASTSSMTLEQATNYLKKIGEWESARRFDRETILGWANFLNNRENSTQKLKKPLKKQLANTI